MRRGLVGIWVAVLVIGPCVWEAARDCMAHSARSPAEQWVALGNAGLDDPRCQDPEVVDVILRAATSPNTRHRQLAYEHLLFLVADPFDRHPGLSPDRPPHAQVNGTVAVWLLARGLRDPDVAIRRGVAQALTFSPFCRPLKQDLYAALCDTDDEVRRYAAQHLLDLGAEGAFALPRIRQAAGEDPEILPLLGPRP